ncbi:CPBP family intramembrane glutamic endopeptidase [Streptococcus cameli]
MRTENRVISSKQVYTILGLYLGLTVLSYLVIHGVFQIDYGTEAFVFYKFPFLLVTAGMMVWFVNRYNKELSISYIFPKKWSFYLVNFVPLASLVLFFMGTNLTWKLSFWLPFLSTLLVGVGEEFLFRRVILAYCLKRLPFHKAIIVSALVFGLSHGVVILSGSAWKQVLLQIILASLMGIYYSFLYLFTGKIEALALDHALWDYLLVGGALRVYPLLALSVPVLLVLRFVTSGMMVWNYQKRNERRR